MTGGSARRSLGLLSSRWGHRGPEAGRFLESSPRALLHSGFCAAAQPPTSAGQALPTCGTLHHLLFLGSSLTVTFTVQLQAGGIHRRDGKGSEEMAHS